MSSSNSSIVPLLESSSCKRGVMVLIALLCSTLYLAGNGTISLWDRDEAWYSQTAREMAERGDYVVPTFNGEPRYRKPVLIYWLIAAAYCTMGDTEFAARFSSAIAGTVTCLLTYRLGARMCGHRAGLVAGLMLAVAPLMVIESKLATTDAVLTALLTGAMSCIWELKAVGFSWRYSLSFWSLMGLAVLTKGPFIPLFVTAAMLAWLMLSGEWIVLRRMNWLAGITLATAICLPWGVAIYLKTGGQFYAVALGQQALGHSFSAMNNHRGFPGYYLMLVLVGLLPWSFVLSLAFSGIRDWARRTGPESFLLGWIIGPMIMLEIMRTKLPQYYLPALPAWSILLARGVVYYHESGNLLVRSISGKCRVLAYGCFGVIAAVALASVALPRLPLQLRMPALTVATVLAAGTAASLIMFWRANDRMGWSFTVATWWSMALVLGVWLLPSAEQCRVMRASATALRAEARNGSAIVLFKVREPSIVFYVGKPVPTFSSPKRLADFVRDHETAYTLLRDDDVPKLLEQGIAVDWRQPIETQPIQVLDYAPVFLGRLSMARDSESATLDRAFR